MGNTKSGYAPKATFTVAGKGKNRVFTAVNKKAKRVAKKAGKRTKLSYAQLKALKGKGTYKFYQYAVAGQPDTLKPIRF